uniref:Putative secreted protein salivary gland overexpressed n=1 Tax=Rhipicephalus microplus TaxID=6941 RepID=A0A6M2DBJ0_RHIMP
MHLSLSKASFSSVSLWSGCAMLMRACARWRMLLPKSEAIPCSVTTPAVMAASRDDTRALLDVGADLADPLGGH